MPPTSTHRPPAASTSGKAVRTSASRSGTNSSTDVRVARGQFGRATYRDVGARHPQALLGGRDVDHDRQQRAVRLRLAQQRHGPGRGTVTDYPAAG